MTPQPELSTFPRIGGQDLPDVLDLVRAVRPDGHALAERWHQQPWLPLCFLGDPCDAETGDLIDAYPCVSVPVLPGPPEGPELFIADLFIVPADLVAAADDDHAISHSTLMPVNRATAGWPHFPTDAQILTHVACGFGGTLTDGCATPDPRMIEALTRIHAARGWDGLTDLAELLDADADTIPVPSVADAIQRSLDWAAALHAANA